MERERAIESIRKLIGVDLRLLAGQLGITVFKPGGGKNKGWAGHVIERHLGLPLNSAQAPNFGSWELKVVALKRKNDGTITAKETMAITMIDPVEVREKEFEDSHLFLKLRKAVVVGRIWESQDEGRSLLYNASIFDLTDEQIYNQIKEDYDLVRSTIRTHGFHCLTGRMGVLVQPRTKGPGHGSTSRAFYARKALINHILGL